MNARLFEASYSDQSPVEIQVDPAIDPSSAKEAAERYATILGRIPVIWRSRIAIFTISPGDQKLMCFSSIHIDINKNAIKTMFVLDKYCSVVSKKVTTNKVLEVVLEKSR